MQYDGCWEFMCVQVIGLHHPPIGHRHCMYNIKSSSFTGDRESPEMIIEFVTSPTDRPTPNSPNQITFFSSFSISFLNFSGSEILNLDYNLKNSFIKFEKSNATLPTILKRFMTEFNGLVKQTIYTNYTSIK
jgi:hypothetical protein